MHPLPIEKYWKNYGKTDKIGRVGNKGSLVEGEGRGGGKIEGIFVRGGRRWGWGGWGWML